MYSARYSTFVSDTFVTVNFVSLRAYPCVLGRNTLYRQLDTKFRITPEEANFPETSVYFSHNIPEDTEDSKLQYVQAFPDLLPAAVPCVFGS
jgi:hypothetical protein